MTGSARDRVSVPSDFGRRARRQLNGGGSGCYPHSGSVNYCIDSNQILPNDVDQVQIVSFAPVGEKSAIYDCLVSVKFGSFCEDNSASALTTTQTTTLEVYSNDTSSNVADTVGL